MAGRRHQQHHGRVGDRRRVRVGTIGDGDAPTPGGVEIDRLIACADRAGDLEIRQLDLNQLTPIVLLRPSPDLLDIQRGRDAGAIDTWGIPASHWDLFGRIQTLLRLKKYMDEQAKSVVFTLARSVDSKQNLRNGHSERLVAYAEQLGEGLGLGDEDLHELRVACWLHDIGKINLPESILLKPGPLDAEEKRIMQEHPIIGEKICAPLKSLRKILPVIRHHHEKMDGSGYPDGLRGEPFR